jgi:hypothetical protein
MKIKTGERTLSKWALVRLKSKKEEHKDFLGKLAEHSIYVKI